MICMLARVWKEKKHFSHVFTSGHNQEAVEERRLFLEKIFALLRGIPKPLRTIIPTCMATFKIARDGHFFVTRGYPLSTAEGVQEIRCATYQVLPRAESLFTELRFRDGDTVPEELFYILVLEGDLTNDYFVRKPSTVWSVPKAFRDEVARAEDLESFGRMLKLPVLRDARTVLEYFRILRRIETHAVQQSLYWACLFSLGRHLRQYAHDQESARNLNKHLKTQLRDGTSKLQELTAELGRLRRERGEQC